MAQLTTKITAYLGRTPDFQKDVLLQDDMVGGVSNPYIKNGMLQKHNQLTIN